MISYVLTGLDGGLSLHIRNKPHEHLNPPASSSRDLLITQIEGHFNHLNPWKGHGSNSQKRVNFQERGNSLRCSMRWESESLPTLPLACSNQVVTFHSKYIIHNNFGASGIKHNAQRKMLPQPALLAAFFSRRTVGKHQNLSCDERLVSGGHGWYRGLTFGTQKKQGDKSWKFWKLQVLWPIRWFERLFQICICYVISYHI